MAKLFIHWPDIQTDHLYWQLRDRGAPAAVAEGTLAQAAAFSSGRRATLFIGAQVCNILHVDLPTRSLAKARSAAPFALEEQFADEIETMHLAVGRQVGGRYPVVAVRSHLIETIQQQCKEHGLQLMSILPDALCLPISARYWTVSVAAERWLIRQGVASAMAVPAALGPVLLTDLQAQHEEEDAQLCLYGEAPLANVEEQHPAADTFLQQLDSAHAPVEINLLQGGFGSQSGVQKHLLPWRRPALMLVCLGLCWVAGLWFDQRDLNSRWAQLQAQQKQVFQGAFPDVARVFDPVKQMRAKLRSLDAGETSRDTLLPGLAGIAAGLGTAPDNGVQNLQFRNGRMELEVDVGSLDDLEKVRKQLASSASMNVTIQSARQEQGRVYGRLRMEGAS